MKLIKKAVKPWIILSYKIILINNGNLCIDKLVSFVGRYAEMKSCPNTYYTTVIEDTFQNKIIGAATLVVEQKFIHGCGRVS